MKNLIIILFMLFIGFQSQAQTFSREWFEAFKADDVEFVNANVNTDNIDNCFLIKGNPYNLLSAAIKLESKMIFNSLIERKANLNLVCKGKTPAMYAVKYGQLDMLKILTENGADLTLENEGKTVKDYARNYKKAEIEKYLLSIEDK